MRISCWVEPICRHDGRMSNWRPRCYCTGRVKELVWIWPTVVTDFLLLAATWGSWWTTSRRYKSEPSKIDRGRKRKLQQKLERARLRSREHQQHTSTSQDTPATDRPTDPISFCSLNTKSQSWELPTKILFFLAFLFKHLTSTVWILIVLCKNKIK
jgi:hypothetical protein